MILRLLRNILLDLLRTRFVVVYFGLLLAGSFTLFSVETDAGKVMISLLNIILMVVPLVSVVYATIHFHNSYDFISLMVTQPVKRSMVFMAQFAGLGLAFSLAFLLGTGIPMLIYQSLADGWPLLFSGFLLTLVFVLMPSVEATFQILNQLCTSLYLLMYILMLAAAIRLRYSQSDRSRPFSVPGGLTGMWLLAGCGILMSAVAFLLSFFPPSQISVGSPVKYSLILLLCFLAALSLPLAIYRFARPDWKPPC